MSTMSFSHQMLPVSLCTVKMLRKHFLWLLHKLKLHIRPFLIPISYRIYLWKKVFNVLKVVFVANAPENLSSGRYLLCMNSLSRRHSASWWNSNNLLTVIRVRTCWKVIMMKNYDNGGHYAMPCHQDILHSYRILSFIGGHHYSCMSFNKRLSIYYVIRGGGGVSPTYYNIT